MVRGDTNHGLGVQVNLFNCIYSYNTLSFRLCLPQPANSQMRAELAYARACVAYAVGRAEDAVNFLNEALDRDPWHYAASAALHDLRAKRVGADVPDAASIAISSNGRGSAATSNTDTSREDGGGS